MAAARGARQRDGDAARRGRRRVFPVRACWRPVEANGVFVDLPQSAIDAVRAKGWQFYSFVGETGVRFMCSWDTTPASVDAIAADLRAAMTS